MTATFYGLCLIILCIVLGLSFMRRPREGLMYGWLFALLLLPGWMEINAVGKFTLDLRTVAAVAAWFGFLVTPELGLRPRWSVGDSLICLLLGSMLISEYQCGDFGMTTVPSILMHWGLPYLVGRSFFRTTDDIRHVERFMSLIVVFLALYGISEMVTGINPVLAVTGRRFIFLELEQGQRWGMKRAQGMSSHPIFFGLTLTLLLPWAFTLARQARARAAPNWNRLLPGIVGVGLVSTLSRGPILAGMLTTLGVVFFRKPRWRFVLGTVVVVGGILTWLAGPLVISELSRLIGDNEQNALVIDINGEAVKYTGTSHRVLQFKAYNRAIENADVFGFGGQLTAVRAKYPVHPLFWSVDCHYLLFLLQYGWSGVILFTLLFLNTLYRLGRMAWTPDRPLADLAGGLCSAVAAVGLSLGSAYLALDLQVFWIFCAGLVGNLEALEADVLAEQEYDRSLAEHDPGEPLGDLDFPVSESLPLVRGAARSRKENPRC